MKTPQQRRRIQRRRTQRRILAFDVNTGSRGTAVVGIQTTATPRVLVSAENTRVVSMEFMANQRICWRAATYPWSLLDAEVVFEGISSYGAVTGRSIHRTLLWIGRLWQALDDQGCDGPHMVLRASVRAHLCGPRAGDADVAQALRDRFGGTGATNSDVKGRKVCPGPLYGIKADLWAALAVAVAFAEGARAEDPFAEAALQEEEHLMSDGSDPRFEDARCGDAESPR